MKQFLLYSISILLFCACKKDKAQDPLLIDSFDFKQGMEWYYVDSVLVERFYTENGQDKDTTFTSVVNYKMVYTKDTILKDSIPVMVFAFENLEDGRESYRYIQSDQTGLRIIANKGSSPNFFHKSSLKLSEYWYSSVFFDEQTESQKANDSDINYLDEPALAYKFPIEIGSQWSLYSEPTISNYTYNRKVHSEATINSANRLYRTLVYDHEIINDKDSLIRSDTNWVSSIGVLKTYYEIKGFYFLDLDGEFQGTGNLYHTVYLKSLKP
jgi:hypothetical protein